MSTITVPSELAEYKQFDYKSTTPLQPDIICLHTMVWYLEAAWGYANKPGKPYWHFGVAGDGFAIQGQDLRFRAAANLYGNWRVISVETSDVNEGGTFPVPWSNPYWTDAQIVKLAQLIAWLCVRFNIPCTLIPDTKPGRRGIAYHRQGVDPWRVEGGELWSSAYAKACPAERIVQVTKVIALAQSLINYLNPNITGYSEDDVPYLVKRNSGSKWYWITAGHRMHIDTRINARVLVDDHEKGGGKVTYGGRDGGADNYPRPLVWNDASVNAYPPLRELRDAEGELVDE